MLLLDKNSKAGCLFRPNFLTQVVIEIQKMSHPRQKFSKSPRDDGTVGKSWTTDLGVAGSKL